MTLRRLKKIPDLQKSAIFEELKTLLENHEEVSFALLYGSIVVPEIPEMYGDIDLAMYVRPERLENPEYILESKIESEAYILLSQKGLEFPPVEALVINNAPYSFLAKLFKSKYIVLKEDEEVLTDFIDEVGRKSMMNSHLRTESLRELLEG